MEREQETHSLTELQGNPAGFLAQLKATGRPVVLTVNGKAEMVVQDAESYKRLLDLARRQETVQAVKEALASVDRGEGRQADEAFEELENEMRARKAR
jgi:prevent-host-death family protein